MAAYMEVHMVVEMVADKKRGQHGKKMADMEFDMVVDMEVDKVADMFKTKCIKPEIFLNEVYWAEAV